MKRPKIKILKIKVFKNQKIHLFFSVKSTNTLAKKYQVGDVLIAKRQTKGRGTHERSFISPLNKGIYMSLVLNKTKYQALITPIVSVIISDTIDQFISQKTAIKWINDIYLNDKKICGILTEMGSTLIIGIGINLYHHNFKIMNVSTIEDETNEIVDINNLISCLINNIYTVLNKLNDELIKNYLDKYINKSNIIGKKIKFVDDDIIYDVLAINDECHLIIKGNNEIKEISTSRQYQIY